MRFPAPPAFQQYDCLSVPPSPPRQKHITKYVWRVDYAGICILIVTSFYPFVYYGFMCHTAWLTFYIISTTAMGE